LRFCTRFTALSGHRRKCQTGLRGLRGSSEGAANSQPLPKPDLDGHLRIVDGDGVASEDMGAYECSPY
jgi:hypothetical protein